MPRRSSDILCGLAGLTLVVVVFLPWWEFDATRMREILEPPADFYAPTTPAYLGTLLIAGITALAAMGLRRP